MTLRKIIEWYRRGELSAREANDLAVLYLRLPLNQDSIHSLSSLLFEANDGK